MSTLVLPYPAINSLLSSPDFSLSVDGKVVWTEYLQRSIPPLREDESWFLHFAQTHALAAHIAAFACDGPCEVTIRIAQSFREVTIRPKSLQTPYTRTDNTLTMQIPGPGKLQIEIDDLPPLLLFADPLPTVQPATVTRVFGPGVHEPGIITLQNGDDIYLAPGAIVYGGLRGAAEGARVSGQGTLDGSRLDKSMCILDGASDVLIEGITMRCGVAWQNTLRNCDGITYRNVKVLSFVPYGDGIDPVSSKNISIQQCYFRCSDDCMAVKAFTGGGDVSGITVTDSIMAGYAFGDGFTIGFEADCEAMENIVVRNCDILYGLGANRVDGHSGFSIICDGHATIRNVVFENIRVEEQVLKLFELNVTDSSKYMNTTPGHIENVLVKDVTWEAVKPMILHGEANEHAVENVIFQNCTVAGKSLQMDDAFIDKNVFVRNVVIKP